MYLIECLLRQEVNSWKVPEQTTGLRQYHYGGGKSSFDDDETRMTILHKVHTEDSD